MNSAIDAEEGRVVEIIYIPNTLIKKKSNMKDTM